MFIYLNEILLAYFQPLSVAKINIYNNNNKYFIYPRYI